MSVKHVASGSGELVASGAGVHSRMRCDGSLEVAVAASAVPLGETTRGDAWLKLLRAFGRCAKGVGAGCAFRDIVAFIGCHGVSEALASVKVDWTVCRCRIHEVVECGVNGAEGCRGQPYGGHGAIRSLYEGMHRACVVEPGVRALDKKLLELVELGRGKFENPRRFARGFGTTAASLGAFYCYLELFPPEVIVRVARIIGPRPPAWRVLLWYLLLGSDHGAPVRFEILRDGQLHFARQRGVWLPHVQVVRCLMSSGPLVTVGASQDEEDEVQAVSASVFTSGSVQGCAEEIKWNLALRDSILPVPRYEYGEDEASKIVGHDRVVALRQHLCAAGLEVSEAQLVNLSVVCFQSVRMPLVHVNGKDRVKVLAILGDSAMRLVFAQQTFANGWSSAKYTSLSAMADNASIVRYLVGLPVAEVFDFEGLPVESVVRATYFEALLGGVCVYFGFERALRFAIHVGFIKTFSSTGKRFPAAKLEGVATVVPAEEYAAFRRWQVAQLEAQSRALKLDD